MSCFCSCLLLSGFPFLILKAISHPLYEYPTSSCNLKSKDCETLRYEIVSTLLLIPLSYFITFFSTLYSHSQCILFS